MIGVTETHRELAAVAAAFVADKRALQAARARLDGNEDGLPSFWKAMAALGWLGLHVPEEYGGAGYGIPELVVIVEQLGRGITPGPYVPTVAASAVIAAVGSDTQRRRWLPGMVDGSVTAAVGVGGDLTLDEGRLSGSAGVICGGAEVDVFVVAVGDDLVVVEAVGSGVSVGRDKSLDPSRSSARVALDDVAAADDAVITGAAEAARAICRTLFAAEATGIASVCTELATEYAKVRQQFGRPIAMFQAVKHHCANMLVAAEIAAATTWDAARAASVGGDEFHLAAAMAAANAFPAAVLNTNLNIQVHGGIGFTWEHDAHLWLRRALTLEAIFNPDGAAQDVTALSARGVVRQAGLDLPPEAESLRVTIGEDAKAIAALDRPEQRAKLIETGYAMPHWPKPWGREATAIEQLVIEEQFNAYGVRRPQLGITGWVILTIIQHGTADQVERWVQPTLAGDMVWCQLFSEPDAGSDAAGIKTKGVRVEGGWLVNGQKVWTSGAHIAHMGLATVRTDPDAAKHSGITTLAIDMHAEGVEVRPLRQITGGSDFNEVFFTDLFVPDDDVVGTPDAGWTVARATLGNERVSIGGGSGGGLGPSPDLMEGFQARPSALPGGSGRLGRYIGNQQALGLLNLRRAQRAVSGAEPGPEGNVTKLLLAEQLLEMAAISAALAGQDLAFTDGPGAIAAYANLGSRALSIAGGTSEITRNQIGERILGLPRDPLLR